MAPESIKRPVHFRSDSFEWATPQAFFDSLHAEFRFELDVCATAENAKCDHFFTLYEDGLKQEWTGVCWCNPPYGREISQWMRKSLECSVLGHATVVCLVPARTDTGWWHDFVSKASEIRYLRGRLKFGGHQNSAPFPSAVVIFERQSPKEVGR